MNSPHPLNHLTVLPWENLDDFLNLTENLREEHKPQTQTELLLVEQLAQHAWLIQRALRLQDMCFQSDVPVCDQPKDLALYIRYQTTNERSFHKALKTLQQLQKSRTVLSQQTQPEPIGRPQPARKLSQWPAQTSSATTAAPSESLDWLPNPTPRPISLRPTSILKQCKASGV